MATQINSNWSIYNTVVLKTKAKPNLSIIAGKYVLGFRLLPTITCKIQIQSRQLKKIIIICDIPIAVKNNKYKSRRSSHKIFHIITSSCETLFCID